jgi:hypothetical protein
MSSLSIGHASSGATGPVALAPSANPYYPLGWSAPSDRPLQLGRAALCLMGNNANDTALIVRLVQADTQGTSGSDLDPAYDDQRVTATAPDGQTNMSGTSTSVPNGNVRRLFGPISLHPSDKWFGEIVDAEGNPIVVPAGKVAAWEVLNPATNAGTPSITIEQNMKD